MARRFISATLLAGAALALSTSALPTPALAHGGPDAAMPPAPPPQGVYQGTWQGGAWTGQWVQAPGATGPSPVGYPPFGYPMPWPTPAYGPVAGPDARDVCERDGDRHHHDRGRHDRDGCAAPAAPYAYGYPMAMPMMMVPVMIAPQQPCVETKTVTYEYVRTPRRRVVYVPRRVWHEKRVKEKRVYTGS